MISRDLKSKLMIALCYLLLGLALIPLLSILYTVISRGLPALSFDFFFKTPVPVGEIGGGIGHAIVGTLVLILMASAIGVPLGLGMGILRSEYPKRKTARALRTAVEVLSSVPSIVVGLFAYAVIVKPMKGFSAHAGAVALAIVMVPMIARSSEEMLKLVPTSVREAGLALGLPRWKVILRIVVGGSVGSLMVSVLLAVARIAGETAPLLFTAFGSQRWFQGLNEPTASLPVTIYNYAISPYEDWHEKAWGAALVLIILVVGLNLFVRMMWTKRRGTQ
jgi:phosphate transport system permease protein